MECNHMVGITYSSCSGFETVTQEEIDAGEKPWTSARATFDPFNYCPYCGVKLERSE